MTDDLSTVETRRLEAWAYGRPTSGEEADRARAAAIELERRARDRRAEKVGPLEPGAAAAPGLAAEESALTPVDEGASGWTRPTRRQAIVAAAIAAAIVAGAIVILPLLESVPESRSSLNVFDSDFSGEERELLTLLQREGQFVSVGPRVIGSIEFGTVMAYRSIRTEPGQPERDDVCLAVSEFDRSVQSLAIADWQCIDRAVFEAEGASVTLFGLGGQYDVDWGPTGVAQLDVIITEAQRRAMEPGIETIFVDRPASDVEQAYVDAQPFAAPLGLALEQVRLVFPLESLVNPESAPEGPTDPAAGGEWIAASIAAAIGSSERLACLSVIDPSVIDPSVIDPNAPGSFESAATTCLAIDQFGRRGLSVTIERAGVTIIVSWSSSGDISAMTTGAG